MVTPAARRSVVAYFRENHQLSERRACTIVGLYRSSYRYQAIPKNDDEIRLRLRELAQKRRKFGAPRLHIMLRREGYLINHKRTERLYREEGLSLRLKKRRKRTSHLRVVMGRPSGINQHWSMDFVSDSLYSGRRFRVLTIVDDFSRECPALEADHSLTGKRVTRVLDRIALIRGLPKVITVDNGPEFISKALDLWAYDNKVKLRFIQPGKPVQNAFIESFNGKFRDECLNDNVFINLHSAQQIIENWRQDYNSERPHSSLNDMTPEEFAATFNQEQLTENTNLNLAH
ncbi:Putative transposase InsK for insertion sequence element IS150 [Anaerolineales bacterium]|nr:Putative transposase InsK for insertion sequence element IS150 [Anaerolineales bacterium]